MADRDAFLLLPRPRSIDARIGTCNCETVEEIVEPFAQSQRYRLTIDRDRILVHAPGAAGFFYARKTLDQLRLIHGVALPCCVIEDWPDFPARGVMLDVSRDKVPTMATLFALIDRLASWKINQLQLYFEHTFAYRDHQTVWANASPFTPDEVRTLDTYCRERFIDLVPNQNSFGHMERWLKHSQYLPLAEAPDGAMTPWGHYWHGPFSLCPIDPMCIEFLSGLYDELLPNFTSDFFNVGCDETFDIGAGRSAKAVAERGVHSVYFDFLKQVHAEVAKRGRRMMFWGDIIRKAPEIIADLREQLPGAIAMVWDYEASTQFDHDGAMFGDAEVPFYVCPGTSSWCSIAGRTDVMLANARSAAVDGLKHGAIGYLMTDWGDYGHLQYLPVSYAGFAAGAAMSWCAASNEPLPLAALLDRFAFEDEANVLGECTLSMGNVYQASGLNLMNASALFRAIVPPKTGVVAAAGMTRKALDASMDAIEKATAGIERAKSKRADGPLILDEFKNGAAMLRLAVQIARSQLGDGDIDRDFVESIVAEHRRLWLARNRPGGLEDSVARLTRVIA